MIFFTRNRNRAFTLIEILVVIAVISVVSSVMLSSFDGAKARARDAIRRADLLKLQIALKLYRYDHGRYPITTTYYGYQTVGCGAAMGLSGPGGYIPDLAPTYIEVLPVDPSKQFGGCSGYIYISDGIGYKLFSHWVGPESYPDPGEPFYDPIRPGWSWMVCSGEPACSTW